MSDLKEHQFIRALKILGFKQDGLTFEDYVAKAARFKNEPITRDQFEMLCDMQGTGGTLIYPSSVEQFLKNHENGIYDDRTGHPSFDPLV